MYELVALTRAVLCQRTDIGTKWLSLSNGSYKEVSRGGVTKHWLFQGPQFIRPSLFSYRLAQGSYSVTLHPYIRAT
jgi:hypothetical protein